MEVFILRLITLAVLTTCYISAALANPNLNIASLAVANDIPFKLNYSPADLQYARELISLYNELSDNELKASSVKKITSIKNKNHSFLHLTPSIERMESIVSINDQDSFYKNCSISPKPVSDYAGSLIERIDISLDKYCRSLFLKRIKKFSSNINFSTRDLNFFKEAAPFYVTGESSKDLAAVLKHYKKNIAEHAKFSDILISKYVEAKTRPATEILSSLTINKTLNQFLQNNLHLDSNSGSFFQEEFQRLYKAGQDLTEKGEFAPAKQNILAAISFFHKNRKFIDEKKAWTSAVLAAKSLFYKGQDADAIEILTLSRAMAPKEESSEATFYLIWPHLVNKDYKAMRSVVEKNGLEKSFDNFDSKVQFWIAYSFFKTGEVKKGNALFHKIINSSPYSFYSIIALKEVAAQNKNQTEQEILSKLISKDSAVEFKMDVASETLKDTLRRLAVWNNLGHERFATLETRYLQKMDKNDIFKDKDFAATLLKNEHKEFINLNLIRLLHSQDKFIASFKVFQDSLNENSLSLNLRLVKYLFPLSYLNIIQKNSNNLDPIVIISLIRQESAFNPEATSRVGAKGLMQLMPATAKRFNRKIKAKQLNNPEINVSLGTKYLKQLFTRFDGNLIYTLASYNAGENRIDRWKREIFRNEDPLATIESIPFEETRNYVKLIYRNKFFYSLLSNRSVLTTPLDESFKITFNE